MNSDELRLEYFQQAKGERYKWAKKVDLTAVQAFEAHAQELRQERLDRISNAGGFSDETGGIVLSAS